MSEEQVLEQQEQIQATETDQSSEATEQQADESAQSTEQVDEKKQPADTDEPESKGDSDEDSDESEERKRPGGWQKRVNNLTWRNRQLQREMDTLKARLDGVAPQDENDQRNIQSQPDPEQVVRNIEWQQRKDEFAKSVPDWDKAVESAQYLPKTPELESAILDSEHGPALFYELAKNPRKAVELTYMSPTELAREIGRMEARIEMRQPAKAQQAQQQPKQRPSSAPPPIKPVQPNGGVQPKKDIYTIDDPHEYYRMRFGKK